MIRKISIPEKLFIGFSNRQGIMPLGFATPYGTDKASVKRISNVTRWASKEFPETIIDNVPLDGFKLTADIRTSNYGSADSWRIEDPRGFELEIKSPNLAKLMSECTIENGEILDTCIWGRVSGNNYLMSTAGEDYSNALDQQVISKETVSIKKCKPGFSVVLKTGEKGTYLGKVSYVTRKYTSSSPGKNELDGIAAIESSTSVFLLDKCYSRWHQNTHSNTLKFVTVPKISSIISENTELTPQEIEDIINTRLHNNTTYIDHKGYGTILGASVGDITYSIELESDDNPGQLKSKSDKRRYFIELASGDVGEVDDWKTTHGGPGQVTLYMLDPAKFKNGQLVGKYVTQANTYHSWNSSDTRERESFPLKEIIKHYFIKITISPALFNPIEYYV